MLRHKVTLLKIALGLLIAAFIFAMAGYGGFVSEYEPIAIKGFFTILFVFLLVIIMHTCFPWRQDDM